jgi:hypothetical protein
VADYSEFPTTPTGWQERAWQEVAPLPTEDQPVPARRPVDYLSLVFGVAFTALAVALMTGIDIPVRLFHGGGILWALLIVAGVVLLAGELRKNRR